MKRILSLLLSLTVFFSAFSVLGITAFATEYTEESVSALYPGVSDTADGVSLSYTTADQTVPAAVKTKEALGQKATSRSYFEGKKVSEKDNTSFLIDNAYGPVEGKDNINMLQVALNQYGVENNSGITHYEENEDKSVIKTTVELKYGSVIDSIVVGCSYGSCYTIGHYKVYASQNEATLFDDGNYVGEFNSRKIKSETGSYGQSWSSYWPNELKNQIFTFSEPKAAQYIGLKILATGYLPLDAGDNINPYTGTYPTEYIPTGAAQTSNQYVRLLEFNAYGTYNKDIQVDTLNANLTFGSEIPVSLKVTDFKSDFYSEIYKNNLLRNTGASVKFVAGTTDITAEMGAQGNLCDGVIDNNGQWGTYMYAYNQWTDYNNNPSGTITLDFGKKYYFDTLYLMTGWKCPSAIAGYNVYVSDSEATLYNSENKIMEYSYTGYTANNDTSGKLNTADNSKTAEGSYYTFSSDKSKQPLGRYIGFEITKNCVSTANPAWLYVCELGATGIEYKSDVDVNNDNLTFTAYYPATMKVSNIAADYFTSNIDLLNSNLLKKDGVTYAAYKSDGTTAITLKHEQLNNSDISNITDGVMDAADGSINNSTYLYAYDGVDVGKTPEGYLTFSLDETYIFDDFYLMSAAKPSRAIADYELYIAEDKAKLYNPENRVYHFKNDGYIADDSETYKLNSATSEGQYVTFTGDTKPTGKYIGIKIFDASNMSTTNNAGNPIGWVYITEAGAHGTYKSAANLDMSLLDTSSFNDEVSIVPDISQRDLAVGQSFKFKVNTKNSAKVLKVTAGGVTLSATDGVYTIESVVENMKIEITTDRDHLATKNNIYNGVDLSKNSSQYDKTLWDGDVIYGESAIVYEGRNQISLLYPIKEIISVRSADLQTVYELGKDYNVVDGKIVLTANTAIPVFTGGNTYLDIDNADWFGTIAPYWNTNQWKYQIYVTYTHSTNADGKSVLKPTSQISNCEKLLTKLKNKEHISITFHGDSITCGCNASGLNTKSWSYQQGKSASELAQRTVTQYSKYGLSSIPNWACDTFAEIVTEQLKEMYGYDDISLYNHGIGSTASEWGSNADNLKYLIGENTDTSAYNYAEVPDLLCIGYGMNEHSSTSINANIKKIIDYARTLNPDCAILIYSAFKPTFTKSNNLDKQETAYYDLLNEYDNIMIVPVNSIFTSLSELGKEPLDWTDNGLNHPNDFGVRLYAASILETLNADTKKVTVKDPTGKIITTLDVTNGQKLSAEQLTALRTAIKNNASDIYGYELVYNNGNYDFNGDITATIVADQTFTVRYQRLKTTVTVTVKGSDGKTLATLNTLFDKALDLNKYGYTKWVINGSTVDTSENSVYVTGNMTITAASSNAVADRAAVLGNAANGDNAVVFGHTTPNTDKTVKETGVIFVLKATADKLTERDENWYNFAVQHKDTQYVKHAYFDGNVNDFMVTYKGAKQNTDYVVRVYVLYTDGTVDYSSKYEFTK